MTKEELLEIVNNPDNPQDLIDDAKEQISRLENLEKSEVSGVDADVRFAVEQFNRGIEQIVTKGVDKQEVAEIVNKEFRNSKIGIDNLDKSVKELIGKSQTVQIVNYEGVTVKTSDGKKRKVFDIILSDFEAGNNVYLYGGAGTGKTFIAGQIAKAINYKLVTLNCNQFTSPLDIIGGQTIEGYQEGRLITAFGNLDLGVNPATGKEFSGALLLLDELPKLDPNTAGVLNDGLSKIKDPIEKSQTGKIIPPTITNGRGQAISKGKIFVIATGNSLLNEADADYEANFKQDLSLQDRFAGSTYELIIDPEYELNNILQNIMVDDKLCNFTFIFNFLFRLREVIEKYEFQGRAFVSQRLSVSCRDTYIAYRLNERMGSKKIPNAKTLQVAITTFLSLFTSTQQNAIKSDIDVDEFFTLVDEKNKMPLDKLDTEKDIEEAEMLISAFQKNNQGKIT
jgi:cobaltochelatase CobS|tara:strand:+ start:413 stop:1771 length:1359 start_codon:yes stop_codon:yes gene_type:complete